MYISKNPSALQSQKWIMEALVKLMETKDFHAITISEITQQADLVRRTFYRNFNSKEEVLQTYLNTLVNEFTATLEAKPEFDCTDSLRELFLLCQAHKSFVFSLKRSNLEFYVLNSWNQIVPIIHEKMLDQIKNFPETTSAQTLDFLLTFNVGGTFNIILKWLDEGMSMSADELADIVMEFSSGSLVSKF